MAGVMFIATDHTEQLERCILFLKSTVRPHSPTPCWKGYHLPESSEPDLLFPELGVNFAEPLDSVHFLHWISL